MSYTPHSGLNSLDVEEIYQGLQICEILETDQSLHQAIASLAQDTAQQFAGVNTRLNTNQNGVDTVNTRIDSIEDSIDTDLLGLDTRVNTLETISAFLQVGIQQAQTANTSQDSRLNTLEAARASIEAVNADQNNRLTAIETVNTTQNTRLNSVETQTSSLAATNLAQDARLGNLESTTLALSNMDTAQNTRLDAVETTNGTQDLRLTNIEGNFSSFVLETFYNHEFQNTMDFAAIQNQIASLSNATSTRLTAAEGAIGTLQSTDSTLTTRLNNVDTLNTQQDSRLQTVETGLTSLVNLNIDPRLVALESAGGGTSQARIYTKEWHIFPGGSDTTGDGSYYRPFKTFAKALSFVDGSAHIIKVHPGTYPGETISVTQANVDIVGQVGEGGLCWLPNFVVTLAPPTSSIRLSRMQFSNSQVTINSAGSVYFEGIKSSGASTLTKLNTSYFRARDCDFDNFACSFGGSGLVALERTSVVNPSIVSPCNVVFVNCTAITGLNSAGNVYLIDCRVNTASSAPITITGGSFSGRNSGVYSASTGAVAPISITNNTPYQFSNFEYAASGSTLNGVNLNSIAYFDTVNTRTLVVNNVTFAPFTPEYLYVGLTADQTMASVGPDVRWDLTYTSTNLSLGTLGRVTLRANRTYRIGFYMASYFGDAEADGILVPWNFTSNSNLVWPWLIWSLPSPQQGNSSTVNAFRPTVDTVMVLRNTGGKNFVIRNISVMEIMRIA